MFPVYYFDKLPEQLPEDSACYIISKYIYLKKRIGLVDSLVKVDSIDMGVEIPEYANMHLPKIKANKFGEVLGFFRMVYDKYKSEAGIILNLKSHPRNPKLKKVDYTVPHQKVSGGGCHYEIVIDPSYINCGTIHSHANFSAFHSGTDQNDERYFDGLHITVGHVADESFSISACVVINGKRVPVDPCRYIEGIQLTEQPFTLGGSQTKFYHLVDKMVLKADEKYLKFVEPRYVPRLYNDKDKGKNQREFDFKWDNWFGKDKSFNDIKNPSPCQECIFKEFRMDMMLDEIEEDDPFNEKDKDIMERYDRDIPLFEAGDIDENGIKRQNNLFPESEFYRYERSVLKRNIKCDCGTTFFVPNPRESSICPNCEKEHAGKSFTMEDALKMHHNKAINPEML